MRRNYFWGFLLIAIGAAYIARHVLNIYFPIGTIIFAFVFIFWGISLITRNPDEKHNSREREEYVFSNNNIKGNSVQDKYDIIFGSGNIDLTTLTMPTENRSIKIDIIFSSGLIRINPDIPAIIRVDSAFASAQLPDNARITFGNYSYVTRSFKQGLPYVNIKVDVVFGRADIIE